MFANQFELTNSDNITLLEAGYITTDCDFFLILTEGITDRYLKCVLFFLIVFTQANYLISEDI